jgi:hypothetical protein
MTAVEPFQRLTQHGVHRNMAKLGICRIVMGDQSLLGHHQDALIERIVGAQQQIELFIANG